MPDNVRQLLVAKVKGGEVQLQRARNEISELKYTNQRLNKRLAEARFTHGALSLELGALKRGQAGMRAEVRSAQRRADAAALHSEKRCATAIEAMQAECTSRTVLHEVNEQTAREHYQKLESKRVAGIDAAATRESTLKTEIEHLKERTQATATEHLQSITEYVKQVAQCEVEKEELRARIEAEPGWHMRLQAECSRLRLFADLAEQDQRKKAKLAKVTQAMADARWDKFVRLCKIQVGRFLILKHRTKRLLTTLLKDKMWLVCHISLSDDREERSLAHQSELSAWKENAQCILSTIEEGRRGSPRDQDVERQPLASLAEICEQLKDSRAVIEIALDAQLAGQKRAKEEADTFASAYVQRGGTIREQQEEIKSLQQRLKEEERSSTALKQQLASMRLSHGGQSPKSAPVLELSPSKDAWVQETVTISMKKSRGKKQSKSVRSTSPAAPKASSLPTAYRRIAHRPIRPAAHTLLVPLAASVRQTYRRVSPGPLANSKRMPEHTIPLPDLIFTLPSSYPASVVHKPTPLNLPDLFQAQKSEPTAKERSRHHMLDVLKAYHSEDAAHELGFQ